MRATRPRTSSASTENGRTRSSICGSLTGWAFFACRRVRWSSGRRIAGRRASPRTARPSAHTRRARSAKGYSEPYRSGQPRTHPCPRRREDGRSAPQRSRLQRRAQAMAIASPATCKTWARRSRFAAAPIVAGPLPVSHRALPKRSADRIGVHAPPWRSPRTTRTPAGVARAGMTFAASGAQNEPVFQGPVRLGRRRNPIRGQRLGEMLPPVGRRQHPQPAHS